MNKSLPLNSPPYVDNVSAYLTLCYFFFIQITKFFLLPFEALYSLFEIILNCFINYFSKLCH
jgi:hypothetical protein